MLPDTVNALSEDTRKWIATKLLHIQNRCGGRKTNKFLHDLAREIHEQETDSLCTSGQATLDPDFYPCGGNE